MERSPRVASYEQIQSDIAQLEMDRYEAISFEQGRKVSWPLVTNEFVLAHKDPRIITFIEKMKL